MKDSKLKYQEQGKLKLEKKSKLPKIKYGADVIKSDEYKPIVTHWGALYVNNDNGIASYEATYFENLNIFQKTFKNLKEVKIIVTNKYEAHAYNSIICRNIYIASTK